MWQNISILKYVYKCVYYIIFHMFLIFHNLKNAFKTYTARRLLMLHFFKNIRDQEFIFLNFYQSIIDYNVVLVSAVQQSESVIHTHISTLFQILFPYRSLESTDQSSLCSTVGSPYQLSILYIVMCMCQSGTGIYCPYWLVIICT